MPRAERVRVVWEPVWEGAVKNWASGYINKQQWRCDIIVGHDDLLQDAYLIFLKLCGRYPRVIDPRHFMALFKTSLTNAIHDKSSRATRKGECLVDLGADISDSCAEWAGELTNAGYLSALLAEAPEELRLALALLANEPGRIIAPVNCRKPRENLNMKLRRILGLESTFDLKTALMEMLFN